MRPLGVVLSLFWIAFVGFGWWYGIYWQLIDPVPLFLMMLVPLIVGCSLAAVGRRLAG